MNITEQQIKTIEHFFNVSAVGNEDWRSGVIFTLKILNVKFIRTDETLKILIRGDAE